MNKQQILEEVKNEIKNNKRVPILNDIEEGASTSWRERPWAANHEANNGMGIELTQIARHVYCSAVIFGLKPCELDITDDDVIQQIVETMFTNPSVVNDLPAVTVNYYTSLLKLSGKLDKEGLDIQALLLEFGMKDNPEVDLTVRVINTLGKEDLKVLDLLLVLKVGRSLFDIADLDSLIEVLSDEDKVGTLRHHPYTLPEEKPVKDITKPSRNVYPGKPTLVEDTTKNYDFSTSLASVSSISRTRCKLRVCYTALGDVSLDTLATGLQTGTISARIGTLASGILRCLSGEILKTEGTLIVSYEITSRNLFKQRNGLSITTKGPLAIRSLDDISQHAGITMLANKIGNCLHALEKEPVRCGRKLTLNSDKYDLPSVTFPVDIVVENSTGVDSIRTDFNVRFDDTTVDLPLPVAPNGLEIGNTKVTIQGEFLGRTRTYEINI